MKDSEKVKLTSNANINWFVRIIKVPASNSDFYTTFH